MSRASMVLADCPTRGPFPSAPLPSPSAAPSPEVLPAAQFLSWRQRLTSWGGDRGALDWLLDAAAGVSNTQLVSCRLSPSLLVTLRCPRREIERLWARHLAESVPLQYLVGRCCWRDFELEVRPGVLIPRPETELLVDLAVEVWGDGGQTLEPSPRRWADLGTGSGCLAMGLARIFPQSQGLAVDISPFAVRQARRNLLRSGLRHRVSVIRGDWFEGVKPWWGTLHLVLANPPYIPSDAVDRLEALVRDHEPRLALDGGGDGMDAIRRIVEAAPTALAPGGWLLLEHHHDQSAQVLNLVAARGMVDGQSHQDLEGHRRFIVARRPPHGPPVTPWRP
jgi:release factor glutamine methyltransferase